MSLAIAIGLARHAGSPAPAPTQLVIVQVVSVAGCSDVLPAGSPVVVQPSRY